MKTKQMITQHTGILCIILVFFWMFLLFTSCSKNDDLETTRNELPNNPLLYPSIVVNAGKDKLVVFPNNSCTLSGWASYQATNPPVAYKWEKIDGPDSFHLESPNALSTILNELEKGVYTFQITSTAAKGYVTKDTCLVFVGELSNPSSFVVFNNKKWSAGEMWGSLLKIINIYNHIPAGTVFKVYLRRGDSVIWEELPFDDYNSWVSASFADGNLTISSHYTENSDAHIKIEY